MCSKARKSVGVIYRKFYRNTNNSALLNLYTALVRPQLEYASPIWSPYLHKDIDLLQNIEEFALRMSTGRWHPSNFDFTNATKTIPLETRRSSASLCMLYKIVNDMCYFPKIVEPRNRSRELRNTVHHLNQPFAKSNSYFNSFFPRTINNSGTLSHQL